MEFKVNITNAKFKILAFDLNREILEFSILVIFIFFLIFDILGFFVTFLKCFYKN